MMSGSCHFLGILMSGILIKSILSLSYDKLNNYFSVITLKIPSITLRSPQASRTPCRYVWVEVNIFKLRFIEKRQEKTIEMLLKYKILTLLGQIECSEKALMVY